MIRSILVSFILFCIMKAEAQQEDSLFIRRLSDEILTNSKAYENLRVLTKTIGPRLAGSANMVKSEQWGAQAMKVAGADNVWMQECMVPHWDRGGKDEAFALYGKNKKSLSVVALGNSFGSMKAIQAPVILVNNFEELESKKDSIKGKIVFYNYKFKPTFVKTFQGYGDAVRYRSQGASRAAKYGALGVVVRSISHSTDNFPHTGSLSYNDSFDKIPAVAIGLQDADWLSDKLKSERINVSIHTHGKFFPDAKGHNVIGELKGSEFPDEYITVGGHLDSWDNCEGAHDDGAGCVQTIEIIRAFKALGYQPKRTIRFVLFANEENGLRGGNKYADEAKAKNEKHLFALESDAGGFTPRGFGFTASADQFAKIKTWEPLLAPYGACELSIGGGGADIGPLNRALGTAVAGLQPDSQRYFDYHHAANDTFEAVNKRELELGAVNMAALIYLVDKYGL
ncbi:MAG: M20/M25/M40 family metallo-hydrolase [Flavisolibacter sp.]|nr:M20/M25/M40 family metallo-hydrolase [Flavisolibacter sp.]